MSDAVFHRIMISLFCGEDSYPAVLLFPAPTSKSMITPIRDVNKLE